MHTWQSILEEEKQKDYFKQILSTIKTERESGDIIYPKESDIFSALDYTDFNKVKVVIIGQDPYHGENQAHGLCFSVQKGVKTPPSLKNIFKELNSDLGIDIAEHGCLESWAKQGVLMLNSVLTVKAKTPGSHAKLGWQIFTDKIIQELNDKRSNIVFLLWGAYAQKKGEIIDRNKHYVLETTHPSPFSAHRGFLGSKHFSKCNDFLKANNQEIINWTI